MPSCAPAIISETFSIAPSVIRARRLPSSARGSIIERYLVDPCAAANPADLRTEIWWPVEAAATKEN